MASTPCPIPLDHLPRPAKLVPRHTNLPSHRKSPRIPTRDSRSRHRSLHHSHPPSMHWKQEVCALPLIGVVGVSSASGPLSLRFILQVSFILLALRGMVDLVLWEFFLKDVWRRVLSWREAGSRTVRFLRVVVERVYCAVAFWSFCYEVGIGIARLLDRSIFSSGWSMSGYGSHTCQSYQRFTEGNGCLSLRFRSGGTF